MERGEPGPAGSGDLGRLRRWEDSGAIWQVLARVGGEVDIALLTCDAGERVGRLISAEPDVLAWVGDRGRSDEPAARR
ncbi:hypothetical protein ACWKSP_00680 [Micromonosporaceae bacterium Da 78-11]